jgi:uroporphyrinogen-III synthase
MEVVKVTAHVHNARDSHSFPLQGKRIVVTRPREQSGELVERLRALGAIPIECPAIAITLPEDFGPLDRALAGLADYEWVVFTSANAVRVVAARILAAGRGLEELKARRIAAIGPATAAALQRIGCAVSFMPDTYVAEAIVEQIGDVRGKRILLPRADIARKALAEGLRAKGAIVDEVTAYRTVREPSVSSAPSARAALWSLLQEGSVHAITFTSSSTVRYTIESMAGDGADVEDADIEEAVRLLNRAAIVCIGPVTAATARQYGLEVAAVAEDYTVEGLVDALVRLFSSQQ